MIKSRYTVADLVGLALNCLPRSRQGLEHLVSREAWAFVEVKGKGGPGGVRREYQPPAEVMEAIKKKALQAALKEAPVSVAAVIPSATTPPSPGGGVPSPYGAMTVATKAGSSLKDWQRRVAEARMAILREVDRLAKIVGRNKAINTVIDMAAAGALTPALMELVPVANARAGKDGKRTLSRATIYEWFAALNTGKGEVNALAPKDQYAKVKVPTWAGELLEYYQRPQKPSLMWAVEEMAKKHDLDKDRFYHQARRFLKKMGVVSLEAGRSGPRELKNIKPFVRRDSGMLWPADVYTADGHAFDAEVAHPVHGRPFRPEITSVRDVASRRLVGWSIDLAESGLAVLDAMRHSFERNSICSLFYVDNGSGYKNALQSAPGIGMESRLGYTMTHSLPYNSQARGIVEKGHRDIWVRAAKELPTYMGADMDSEAKNKVFKITRADVKVAGASRLLMPWAKFLEFVRVKAEEYNNRPHRALRKVYDDKLGRQRHMTPNEAWEDGVRAGAELVTITKQEAQELFRPMREVKVLRGEVRMFNNLYFSRDLTEYHGEVLRAAYDIHDGSQVWMYDQEGRFICTAGFEANKTKYFPESAVNMAAERRYKARVKRNSDKREEIDQEWANDQLVLENNPSPKLTPFGMAGTPGVLHAYASAPANLDNAAALDVHVIEEIASTAPDNAQSAKRPVFSVDSERYEWLMQHRDLWTDADHKFLSEFVTSDIYQMLQERFEVLGMAWTGFNDADFMVAV